MDLQQRLLGRVVTMSQPRAVLETTVGTVAVRTRVFRAQQTVHEFDGRMQVEVAEPHCYIEARLARLVETGDHLTEADGTRWRVLRPLAQDDGTIRLELGDRQDP